MSQIEYRLYFNNTPATREQLDLVEEIVVEQSVDMAWEARLQVPVGTDAQGNWTGEAEEIFAEFTPVRIELKVGDSGFVPLIDGPIVELDDSVTTEPGQSMMTVVVQDDSVFLNREDRMLRFDGRLDHEVAQELFEEASQISRTDIETTPAPTSSGTPTIASRGTPMQLLRSLARRQGKHAYVLPGDSPGESVGCFKTFTTEPSDLPPLRLTGPERNLQTFSPREDAQRAARVTTYAVSLFDKTVTQRTSSLTDIDRQGPEATFDDEGSTAVQLLSPRYGDSVDLDQLAIAEAERASYAAQATGSVLGSYYQGILLPYRVISVQGVNARRSGNYLIAKVTHRLTRFEYSQDFSLMRNARSAGAGGGLTDLIGGIF